jgi:uncharacterized membrane protein
VSDQGTRKLLVIDFTDDLWAQEFLLAAMRLARSGKLAVHDAVFVSRDAQGHSAVRETTDLTPGRGALGGAVWGLLIGTLLGGPIGGLVGGAAAGGGGALLGKLIDTGIKDDKIKELRETVKPGTTALALQVSNVSAADLEREIERFPGATVVQSDLPEGALHAARTALDEAPPPAVPDDPNIRIGLDDPPAPAPAAPPTLPADDPTADRPSGPARSSTDPTGPPTPA